MDDKKIVLKYLKEKSNENEVITRLQEQKKMLANPNANSIFFNDEYVALIIKLAKNSKGKIKYHALIILSRIEYYVGAKNFYELCKIAANNSNDKDGNVRQASFILTKNLNVLMMAIPLINKMRNASRAEINLFYESFRNLFHRLHFLFYKTNDTKIKENILKSLKIVFPKIYDMAKFWNDQEEIRIINRIKEELNKGL